MQKKVEKKNLYSYRQIKKRLLSEKKYYLEMIKVHSGRVRERLGDSPNTNTNHLADHASCVDVSVSHIPTLQRVVVAIDEALERLKEGKYEQCIECGESISVGRFNAVPWAKKCTACKKAEEEGKTINYSGTPTRIRRPELVTY